MELFPAVGLASPNERVYINLGQAPFAWDFEVNTENTLVFTPVRLFPAFSCSCSFSSHWFLFQHKAPKSDDTTPSPKSDTSDNPLLAAYEIHASVYSWMCASPLLASLLERNPSTMAAKLAASPAVPPLARPTKEVSFFHDLLFFFFFSSLTLFRVLLVHCVDCLSQVYRSFVLLVKTFPPALNASPSLCTRHNTSSSLCTTTLMTRATPSSNPFASRALAEFIRAPCAIHATRSQLLAFATRNSTSAASPSTTSARPATALCPFSLMQTFCKCRHLWRGMCCRNKRL